MQILTVCLSVRKYKRIWRMLQRRKIWGYLRNSSFLSSKYFMIITRWMLLKSWERTSVTQVSSGFLERSFFDAEKRRFFVAKLLFTTNSTNPVAIGNRHKARITDWLYNKRLMVDLKCNSPADIRKYTNINDTTCSERMIMSFLLLSLIGCTWICSITISSAHHGL